jgi:hypothetical protein
MFWGCALRLGTLLNPNHTLVLATMPTTAAPVTQPEHLRTAVWDSLPHHHQPAAAAAAAGLLPRTGTWATVQPPGSGCQAGCG